MANTSIEGQIQNLELRLQLQESNYRYAMELKKDSAVLRRVRYNIKALKELLQSLKEFSKREKRNSPGNHIFKDGSITVIHPYKSPYMRKGIQVEKP